jgi:hypothetical protein
VPTVPGVCISQVPRDVLFSLELVRCQSPFLFLSLHPQRKIVNAGPTVVRRQADRSPHLEVPATRPGCRRKLQGKQKGSIGISLAGNWMVPFSKSLLDQTATQRAIDFRIGWYVHN